MSDLDDVHMSQATQIKKDVVAAFAYSGRPLGDFDALRPLFQKLGAEGVGNVLRAPVLMASYLGLVFDDHVAALQQRLASVFRSFSGTLFFKVF